MAQLQNIPNSGRLQRENQRNYSPPAPQQSLPDIAPQQRQLVVDDSLHIPVKVFRILGSQRFAAEELQQLLAPLTGRELSLAQLRQATEVIAEFYRMQGYLARVYLPEQSLKSGVIIVAVVEAQIGEVRIESPDDKPRIPKSYAQRFLQRQLAAGQPLNLQTLQRAANILNDVPGMDAKVALAKGKSRGETDVVVRLKPGTTHKATVFLDNYGSRSTGEARLSANGYLNNVLDLGDQLQLTGNLTEGNEYGRLAYSLPVGDDGWRLAIHTSRLNYELGKEFEALDVTGDATTEGIELEFPIWRSGHRNLYWVMGFDVRRYEDLIRAVTISQRKTQLFTAGLYGDAVDDGGFSLYGLGYTTGDLELKNSEEILIDDATRQRQGRYSKVTINASRLQFLAPRHNLWLAMFGQLSDGNLDSSEQFSLGGPSGVRAYPVLEGSGDQGALATVEWRYQLAQFLYLAMFYDHGWIAQHKSTWPNWNFGNPSLNNDYQLSGAGWGLNWSSPEQFIIKLDVAFPVDDNPARNPITHKDADGTQREPRLWFSVLTYF